MDYRIKDIYKQLDDKSNLKKEDLLNLQKITGKSGINNRLKSEFSGNNRRKASPSWSSSIK